MAKRILTKKIKSDIVNALADVSKLEKDIEAVEEKFNEEKRLLYLEIESFDFEKSNTKDLSKLPAEKTQPNQPPEAPNFSSLVFEFLPKIKKQVSYCFHMLDSQEDRDYFKKEKGLTTSRLTKLYLAKNLIDVLTLSEFLKLAEMVKDTENQLLINFPD
jgi:hypothetical protein